MKAEAQRKGTTPDSSTSVEPTTMRNTGPSKDTEWYSTPPEISRNSQPDHLVNNASEDSFPASDPPSWTPTTAGSPCTDEDEHCEEKEET